MTLLLSVTVTRSGLGGKPVWIRDGRPGTQGSPTLLIDGAAPFAAPSPSCRLYQDAVGLAGPAPSVQALRHALSAARHD